MSFLFVRSLFLLVYVVVVLCSCVSLLLPYSDFDRNYLCKA
jgi:hypothetical protein